jgi:hypothetical protein
VEDRADSDPPERTPINEVSHRLWESLMRRYDPTRKGWWWSTGIADPPGEIHVYAEFDIRVPETLEGYPVKIHRWSGPPVIGPPDD